MRADFQQFYHLNIDRMGEEYSILHAAHLAAMLPANARVWGPVNQFNAEAKKIGKKKTRFSTSIEEFEELMAQEWEEE